MVSSVFGTIVSISSSVLSFDTLWGIPFDTLGFYVPVFSKLGFSWFIWKITSTASYVLSTTGGTTSIFVSTYRLSGLSSISVLYGSRWFPSIVLRILSGGFHKGSSSTFVLGGRYEKWSLFTPTMGETFTSSSFVLSRSPFWTSTFQEDAISILFWWSTNTTTKPFRSKEASRSAILRFLFF